MQTADFLARVVPPGNFVALSFNSEPGGSSPRFHVRMFKDVADAASYARWASSKGWEVYQCQASYRIADAETKKGVTTYKGSKDASNVVASRALYLDMDVHRPGDKKTPGVNAFASRQDAAHWLARFVRDAQLPQPSIVVDSGYGFHPYWLLDDPLKPADWTLAAHAFRAAMLHCGYIGDAGITTDIARILRTPGTQNLKVLGDPKQVTVKHVGPSHANATILSALQPWMAQAQQAVAGLQVGVAKGVPAGGATVSVLSTGGPAAAFAGTTPTVGTSANALVQGVAQYTAHHRYKMASIATRCGQVQESLRTHGNGDPYPLWYNGFLTLAAFTEDGDQFIGPLSDGDPRFTQQGLDAAWQRIHNEIATKNIGPTTCSWFAAHRPSACATCPLNGSIKSPIVLGRDDTDLPAHYRRVANSIEVESTDEKGNPVWLPVLPGDITDFSLSDDDDAPTVAFRYIYAGGNRVIRFPVHEMVSADRSKFAAFMAYRGVHFPHHTWATRAKDLLVAWIAKMHAKAGGQGTTPAFGWVHEKGKVSGFALAGRVYNPNGSTRASSLGDPSLIALYGEEGDEAKWQAACSVVVKDRPDLTALVAGSFGAPLMHFTGHTGCIISAVSRQSGVGKSSALHVGQAVWGSRFGINNLNDTQNNVMRRIGAIRSLPAFWDELRTGDQTRRFIDTAFQLSTGREKARLNADSSFKPTGSWETLLIAASNEPLMEHVIEHVQGTEAGALRLFEFQIEVPPMPVMPGVSSLIDATRTNYGRVGRRYAQWLAANNAHLANAVPKTIDKVNAALGARTDERFYVTAIACLLQGASIAKTLGFADFQLVELRDFLFSTFHKLRANRARDIVATANGYDLQSILADFMSANLERRLITDKFGTGKTFVKVLQAPPMNRGAHIHVSVGDDTMRINRSALNSYLRERNISHQGVVSDFEKKWGAIIHKAAIGVGTPYTVGHTWVVDIPLGQNGLSDYAVVHGDER